MTSLINRAMHCPEQYIIEMSYRTAQGVATRRTVSPIRYLKGGRLLALCLCREEPRQFYLNRCSQIELKSANDVLMPMPIQDCPSSGTTNNAFHTLRRSSDPTTDG